LLKLWFAEAARHEVNDPEAFTLSTVDASGLPDVRAMLCKQLDEFGLVFYTNVESAKGVQLTANPKAAALFHWKSLRRQVRLRGAVVMIPPRDADDYFVSRPRASRIGAWASQQSRPLESRATLEEAVASYARKFGEGDIPRPAYWNGYRLTPTAIEFWQDVQFRLHDRVAFTRAGEGEPWTRKRLYP